MDQRHCRQAIIANILNLFALQLLCPKLYQELLLSNKNFLTYLILLLVCN